MPKRHEMAEAIDLMDFDPQVIFWDKDVPVVAVGWDTERGGPVIGTGPIGADVTPFALLTTR